MAGQQPAAERPERQLVDLLGLLAIADQIIALRAHAEAVLCPCGPTGEALTRRAERLAEQYHGLWDRSMSFAPHAGPGSLERLLSGLVEQHYQVLQRALRVGLEEGRTPHSAARLTEMRATAEHLGSVRDELVLWVMALTPAR